MTATRPLGARCGLAVSTVGVDGEGLAALPRGTEVAPIVHAALDAEIGFFRAFPYGGGDGFEIMARALGRARETVVLGASAVVETDLLTVADPWRPGRVRHRLESALRRLGTDRLDLWLLHDPPARAVEDDDLWAALEDDRRAGWIAAVGVASDDPDVVRAALRRSPVDAIAVAFPVTSPEPARALAGEAAVAGTGFLATEVLREGQALEARLRRFVAGLTWPDADRTEARAGVAGVLCAEGVTSALVSPASPPAATDLAAAMAWPLVEREQARLHERWADAPGA